MNNAVKSLHLPRLLLLAASTALLAGCASSTIRSTGTPQLAMGVTWLVAPLSNNTATPYAGERAMHLAAALLAHHLKAGEVLTMPEQPSPSGLPIDSGSISPERVHAYAAQHGAQYVVTGSVDEWHYKTGLDGQPAVGFTLSVTDEKTGRIVWTGAASASGGSREGVAVLAQETLNGMVERISGN